VASDEKTLKPHIYLGKTGSSLPFTSAAGGGGSSTKVPHRDRQSHGQALTKQLTQVAQQQAELQQEAQSQQLESMIGIQVEFESFPGVELAVESLADARQQIELLNVTHLADKTFATIFVPEGKLNVIEKKLQAYLDEKRDKAGKPRDNRVLIDAIESFRVAALEALWTDEPTLLPENHDHAFWWEVWLPVRGNRRAVLAEFTRFATATGITVSQYTLEFPERTVLHARGSRRQFASNALLLNSISELRMAKETAAFFDKLTLEEQREWSDELLSRLSLPDEDADPPYICILDTGVNAGHKLLKPFLSPEDLHAIDADWEPTDENGHGTGMAGLAVWGDLTTALEADAIVHVEHRIESSKVLRAPGDNKDKLLGTLTTIGVTLPEIQEPHRTRVFAMAVSAIDTRDQGRPSAWSAAVDNLAVDYIGDGESPRLIALSAGNSDGSLVDMKQYPGYNLLQDIHDPGQAWNALTIGAYTNKVHITEDDCDAYVPLAPLGGLSPHSTTSVTWEKKAPIKPEVVFEGGNVGQDKYACATIPSLCLLTTHHSPVDRHFSTSYATSAATALAARFAAKLYAQYPQYWPETIRALIVHSAEWTEAMKKQFVHGNTERQQAHHRVRCVGYGVPNMEKALWSANNSLSLIIEDSLQPFEKRKGDVKTRDMHLHDLPWPKESLAALGEVEVEMTVTLSYFIEPNPSSRVVTGAYSYQSHNLRFDVKRTLESPDAFVKRINKAARDEEEGKTSAPKDPNWLLGSDFRHKGSIHKDVWHGKASELAARGQVAVYPAQGWWKTRKAQKRYESDARYALIISIAVPDVSVELYDEVMAQVAVAQETTIV